MKKCFTALLFLCWLIPAGMAWAESPILASHTLTGYSKSADSVVLNYTLTVKNTGDSSISNLILSYVPLMIISKDQITLNVGTLVSKAEVQVPFTITIPTMLDYIKFSGQPLFWTGTCTDSKGNQSQFAVNSVPGGTL